MQITLAAVLRMVKEMPETFEFEELQQWIYLRQKLEKDPANPVYILTERGVGYRFVDFKRSKE